MSAQSRWLLGICALVSVVAVGAGVGFDRARSAKVKKAPAAAARVVPPLPRVGALLASAEESEVRGKAFCAYCYWNVGNTCHTALKTDSEPGIVFLARNEKLAELDEITNVCADGTIEVTARGALSQYKDQNYLTIRSLETTAPATK